MVVTNLTVLACNDFEWAIGQYENEAIENIWQNEEILAEDFDYADTDVEIERLMNLENEKAWDAINKWLDNVDGFAVKAVISFPEGTTKCWFQTKKIKNRIKWFAEESEDYTIMYCNGRLEAVRHESNNEYRFEIYPITKTGFEYLNEEDGFPLFLEMKFNNSNSDLGLRPEEQKRKEEFERKLYWAVDRKTKLRMPYGIEYMFYKKGEVK